jgi:hypothetical protein
VRPCSGSCDELDPPTDSCQQDLTLNADTEVLITFRYGQPCAITTRDSDETAPPIEDNMLSAHPCPNSSRKSVDLDIPGQGQPTPQLAVAPYALGSAILISEENGTATVLGLAGYGEPTRVFKVTKREDGWWPDSYVECPR